jgi:phospholipase/carboxylesterase
MQNAIPIQLSGPSRLPAAGGPPKQLVVFLHGYGADGNDLIGLASFFARALPHAEFIAPNAPEPCAMGHGYQWFDVDRLNPPMVRAGAGRAAPILDAFIDRELAARGLSTSNLALIGFSQGTVMALDRAMRGGKSAATVGFSGMVSAAAADEPPPEADRPPILLVHGTADTIVAFTYLAECEKVLSGAGFKVDTLVRPGLAHGIDQEGALAAARFLVAHLA